jgi:hypothetical protein
MRYLHYERWGIYIMRDEISTLWDMIHLHYERWGIYIIRDEVSTLWEMRYLHYERWFINIMRDYFSIWILSPAVYIYRRSELTAVSFLSLYVAFFNRSYLSTNINIRRSFLLPCDFVAASLVHSYGGDAYLPFLYLRLQHYQRWDINIMRDDS